MAKPCPERLNPAHDAAVRRMLEPPPAPKKPARRGKPASRESGRPKTKPVAAARRSRRRR
jgi:hypothetical protein